MTRPARSFLFVGDSQAAALSKLFWFAASHKQRELITYVWKGDLEEPKAHSLLGSADVIVVQDDGTTDDAFRALLDDGRCVAFPDLQADFLWPYADEAPFHNFSYAGIQGPYPAHLGDAILNDCARRRLTGEEAEARYADAERLRPSHLDSLLTWRLAKQRLLDERHGYTLAKIVEDRFRRSSLFRTRHHLQPELLAAVAEQVFSKLKLGAQVVDAALGFVHEDVFPGDEMPIHPMVARHFVLTWAETTTRFQFGVEGRFTFDEFVARFVQYQSNHSLRVVASWLHDGDEALVLTYVEDALYRSPDASFGWYAKGLLMRRLSRLSEAAVALERATALAPEEGDYWAELAETYAAQGGVDEAVSAARSGAYCARGAARSTGILANLLRDRAEPEEAFQVFSRASIFQPQNVDLWLNAGVAALRTERFARAIEIARYLIDEILADANTLNLLAEGLEGDGRRQEAINVLDDGLARQLGNDQTFSLLGHFHLRDGHFDAAERAFMLGIELAPERDDLASGLVTVRSLLKKPA